MDVLTVSIVQIFFANKEISLQRIFRFLMLKRFAFEEDKLFGLWF